MTSLQRRSAFTLIEVLIVVVIMAVLAATIIPQFSTSTKDAKEGATRANLHSLRTQIEIYRMQHLGVLPSGLLDLQQLTATTNLSGIVGMGAAYPYGPYSLGGIPISPITGIKTVKIDSGTTLGVAPAASAGLTGGWIYRPVTGEIWVDHADYLLY